MSRGFGSHYSIRVSYERVAGDYATAGAGRAGPAGVEVWGLAR